MLVRIEYIQDSYVKRELNQDTKVLPKILKKSIWEWRYYLLKGEYSWEHWCFIETFGTRESTAMETTVQTVEKESCRAAKRELYFKRSEHHMSICIYRWNTRDHIDRSSRNCSPVFHLCAKDYGKWFHQLSPNNFEMGTIWEPGTHQINHVKGLMSFYRTI